MIVAYSGNRKVYPAIAASFHSLLEHNEVEKAYIIIEDDDFPYQLSECAEIIDASGQEYFQKYGPNYNCSYSYFTLIRSAYALMFPLHDKLISFDCDTLVKADISELWNTDISDYYFSASMEPLKSSLIYPDIYTNVGVCLMNLKKLREDKKVDEIIARLNNRQYGWPDQDAMNEVCKGKISNKLLYTTIYEKAGINTKMQRSRAKDKIKQYLEHYKKCGFIKDFTEAADGITIKY